MIIQIVVLSLILGLYLNALRGPFVKITSTTTTLTDSSGGLSGISPGDKIRWVDPFTGLENGAFVKAFEDNQTVTTEKPFIIHDEIAPWPPPMRTQEANQKIKKNLPGLHITVLSVDIRPDMSFSEFVSSVSQAMTNDLGLPPHHLGIGKQYRGRGYRRGAPDLTIIEGGKSEKSKENVQDRVEK